MVKNTYQTPTLNITVMSQSDVLASSDVLIDGSGLFDDRQ